MPRPFVRRAALVACALLAWAHAAPAQTPDAARVVTGVVTDALTQETLPGVTVRVLGTTAGAATDRDGAFRLALPPGARALAFTFVGYRTETRAVTPGVALAVALTPSTDDLQPVVVAGSRAARPRAEVPVAVAAVTAADLRATRPNLLAEALNRTPGVLMVDLGNEQHAMAIRQPISLKPFFVYLEDGVPVRPAGLFNHNALIEVNLAATDGIEVVRGPGSALYGAGAIGGAVNVTTPLPGRIPAAEASVRASGAGYGRVDASATTTTPGGTGVYAGGYAAGQQDGPRAHSDYAKASVTLRADRALAPGARLSLTASAHHLATDTDGSLDSTSFFGGGGATSLQTFTDRTVRAGRAALRLDRVWSARQRTSVTAFGRANAVGQTPHYRLRLDAADPARASGEINRVSFTSLGLVAQHEAVWPRGRVLAGGTVDRSPSTTRARYIDVRRDAATGVFTGFADSDSLLTDFDVTVLNTAAFVQGEVVPVGPLRLVASVRADRVGYALDNRLAPGAFSGAADRSDAFARLTPRAGAVVTLAPGAGLYANLSRGFLPPEAGELYRGVQVPTLRPAVFDSGEVGGFVQAWQGRVSADLAVYRMDGRDEIVTVRQPDGSSQDQNAGATRHEGAELGLAVQPSAAVSARLSATVARHTYRRFLVDARAGREVRYDGQAMEGAPGHVVNAEVAVRPLDGLRLAAEVQRVGPYWMNPQNTARYAGHTVVTLRAGYAGRALRGAEFWATLQNLTDARYATVAAVSFGRKQYTPGLPRTLTLGVGVRLGR